MSSCLVGELARRRIVQHSINECMIEEKLNISLHRFSSFAIIVQEVAVEQFFKILNLICEILMLYHYCLLVCKAVTYLGHLAL